MSAHQSRIKWVLIELGALTASGYNEILYGAPTKGDLVKIAKLFGIKVSPHGQYQIVKVE